MGKWILSGLLMVLLTACGERKPIDINLNDYRASNVPVVLNNRNAFEINKSPAFLHINPTTIKFITDANVVYDYRIVNRNTDAMLGVYEGEQDTKYGSVYIKKQVDYLQIILLSDFIDDKEITENIEDIFLKAGHSVYVSLKQEV